MKRWMENNGLSVKEAKKRLRDCQHDGIGDPMSPLSEDPGSLFLPMATDKPAPRSESCDILQRVISKGVGYLAVNKKIPMRKCVGCGEMKPKKELLRILRTETGEFVVDALGKANGRGAYLCRSVECFQKAVKNRGLERSFKQAIPPEVYERMEKEMGELE